MITSPRYIDDDARAALIASPRTAWFDYTHARQPLRTIRTVIASAFACFCFTKIYFRFSLPGISFEDKATHMHDFITRMKINKRALASAAARIVSALYLLRYTFSFERWLDELYTPEALPPGSGLFIRFRRRHAER